MKVKTIKLTKEQFQKYEEKWENTPRGQYLKSVRERVEKNNPNASEAMKREIRSWAK